MTAKGRVFKNDTDVRISTQVQVWELTPDLFAFKRTQRQAILAEAGTMDATPVDSTPVESQGLIDAENLNAMLRGDAWTQDPAHFVFTDEDQEFLRSEDAIIYGQDIRRIRNIQTIYDDLALGLITRNHVFRSVPHLGIFLNLDGRVMPEVIAFWGGDDRMNDVNYNMRRLVDHLTARGDIRFFKEGGQTQIPETFEDTVFTIDKVRYPEVRGRQAVLFAWSPTQQEAQDLFSTLSHDPRVETFDDTQKHLYETIFELDLLGLRAAKAALWTVF